MSDPSPHPSHLTSAAGCSAPRHAGARTAPPPGAAARGPWPGAAPSAPPCAARAGAATASASVHPPPAARTLGGDAETQDVRVCARTLRAEQTSACGRPGLRCASEGWGWERGDLQG